MKILIVPTVREIYKKQFEYSVDLRLIGFFKNIFKASFIEIYNKTMRKDHNLIVFAGGNNSITQIQADKLRNKINNSIYKIAVKKKIKMIGICHGAHFLAKKNRLTLGRAKNHTRPHKVFFNIDNNKFKKNVNSFHNEIIKLKKNKIINIFGTAEDNTVEAFHIKKKNILGIMWHPERYNKIKYFDKQLINKFYATNSIIGR